MGARQGPGGRRPWGRKQAVGSQRGGHSGRPLAPRWPPSSPPALCWALLWFQASPLMQAACRGRGEGQCRAQQQACTAGAWRPERKEDTGGQGLVTPGQGGDGQGWPSQRASPWGPGGSFLSWPRGLGAWGQGWWSGVPLVRTAWEGSPVYCHHSPGLQRPAAASAGLEGSPGPQGPPPAMGESLHGALSLSRLAESLECCGREHTGPCESWVSDLPQPLPPLSPFPDPWGLPSAPDLWGCQGLCLRGLGGGLHPGPSQPYGAPGGGAKGQGLT